MPSLREEIDEIIVDCYGEEEQTSAWEVAFQDEVSLPFRASLLGTPVAGQNFRVNDASAVQCLVVRGEHKRWIGVEDMDEDGLPQDFRHMLTLYRAWTQGGY